MRVQITSADSAVIPERAMVDVHRPGARGTHRWTSADSRYPRRRTASTRARRSAIAATAMFRPTATKVAKAVSCTRRR